MSGGDTRRRRRLRTELRGVLSAAVPYKLGADTEDVIVALLERVEIRAVAEDKRRRKRAAQRKADAALVPIREKHAREARRLPRHL